MHAQQGWKRFMAFVVIVMMGAVLLPQGTASADDHGDDRATIAEIAVGDPELSTLVTALSVATDAGVVDFLGVVSDPDQDLTVFAPTNAAFAALGPVLDDVLADPGGLLTDVLLYHVVGESLSGEELVGAGSATTLLGEDVVVEVRNGAVYINDSQVVIADVQASNGVVHVIDAVLLPPAGETDPVSDGNIVHIVSAVSGRWLDADRYGHYTRVDTSSSPKFDDEWKLEQTADGYWQVYSPARDLYLDADSQRKHYDVNLGRNTQRGTTWEIIALDNGNYLLRTIDYDRYLDYDRHNVDTSEHPRADDEWIITLVNG